MRARTSPAGIAAVAIAVLALIGCASPSTDAAVETPANDTHAMPEGGHMLGAEHPESVGPSAAAQMVCDGQVVDAVGTIVGTGDSALPVAAWDAPHFSCTFTIEGQPLVLSVHDATDPSVGDQHFAALRDSYDGAEEINGMLGLGLPSFATNDGIVGFLRDGKTLLVDATALSEDLGPQGTRTRQEVAYALASTVLVCWVQHD